MKHRQSDIDKLLRRSVESKTQSVPSGFGSLVNLKHIIDLDAEVADNAFELAMAKK